MRTMTLAVRTAGDPLRRDRCVRTGRSPSIDPELPLYSVRTMEDRIERNADRSPDADAAGGRVRGASRCSSRRSGSTACSPTRWRSGGRRSGSAWRSAATRVASSPGAQGRAYGLLARGFLAVGSGRRVRDPARDGDAALRRERHGPAGPRRVGGLLAVVAADRVHRPARRASRIDPLRVRSTASERSETVFLDAGGVLIFPNWERISETLAAARRRSARRRAGGRGAARQAPPRSEPNHQRHERREARLAVLQPDSRAGGYHAVRRNRGGAGGAARLSPGSRICGSTCRTTSCRRCVRSALGLKLGRSSRTRTARLRGAGGAPGPHRLRQLRARFAYLEGSRSPTAVFRDRAEAQRRQPGNDDSRRRPVRGRRRRRPGGRHQAGAARRRGSVSGRRLRPR